jgi:hypothetical protein
MTQKAVRSRNRIVWLIVAVALAIPGALVTAAAVALVWASSTVERLGEPTPEAIARTVTLSSRGQTGVAGDAAGPTAHLDIDLEDGVFEVRPGPPGSDVRVDGTYSRTYYRLVHDHTPSGNPPGRTVTVRLERAHSFLVQLMAHAMERTPSTPNNLTVTIPKGTLLSVDLTIRAGESRVDLGGLSLTDLTVDLAMGEHRLDFSEPLAVAPRQVRLDGGMGEIRFERLGNARAGDLQASGHMGSVTVDLGGAWPVGTMADVTLNNLMGELRLEAPAGLRLVGAAEDAPVPGADGPAAGPGGADPGAPALRLHVSTTMGETRLSRY